MKHRVGRKYVSDAGPAQAAFLICALMLSVAAGCSRFYSEPTSVNADLPVLEPVECSRLRPEETYALAYESCQPMPRDADDKRPYLAGVQITYLAYGLACVYARGENLSEDDRTNGDVAMLLEVRGPGSDLREKRYPYEGCFFDKFFVSGPGRVRIALTLMHDKTGETFDRRVFEAEIGRAIRAELMDDDSESVTDRARVRIRLAADPAHYADKCRTEAILLETSCPASATGRLLGHWKLKLEPQDEAIFNFDLRQKNSGGDPSPHPTRHYALRLRLVDGNKVAESLVLRFSAPRCASH